MKEISEKWKNISWGKEIFRYGAILAGSILGGMILLALVHLLPTDPMYRNVNATISYVQEEGAYPHYAFIAEFSRLDNVTDMVMLGSAIADSGENPFVEASACYWYGGMITMLNDPAMTLQQAVEAGAGRYCRYWFGYLVFLKPLLMFLTYHDIRILNFVLQVILVGVVLLRLTDTGLRKLCLPFLGAWLLLNPAALAASLQYSWVFYTLLAVLLVLLWLLRRGKTRWVPLLFFVSGIVTVYVDLLTYPLVTLGIPMVVYLVWQEQKPLAACADVVGDSILWGLGYGGMWAGKWVLGSLILRFNIIGDALHEAAVLTSTEETWIGSGLFQGLINVFGLFRHCSGWIFVILLVIAGYLVLLMLRYHAVPGAEILNDLIPLGLNALMPIVWVIVISKHSAVHFWMVYRILAITLFAMGAMLAEITERVRVLPEPEED